MLWDAELAKSAMDKLPANFFKKRSRCAPQRQRSQRQEHDQQESSVPSRPSSATKSTAAKDAAASKPSSAKKPCSPTVTAVFRLHRPIPGSRTRVFRAHNVPADGDCLFHSIKILLDLQISVAQLRAQVVNYMETLETDE